MGMIADPTDWLTKPRLRFKLATAYLRIETSGGETHERWRRWSNHCERLGLRDETIALDCVVGMLGRVHAGHGGIHPRILGAA
jgi:hypothetical protein